MELNVLESKKNKLILEIKGEDHTFCNMLKEELWNNKHTKIASYYIKHPLVGVPTLILETDGEDPKKVLQEAVKNLGKSLDKFTTTFEKEIK